MFEFKMRAYSHYSKEIVFDVDCPKFPRFDFDLNTTFLTTRIAINKEGKIRTIWTPDKDHCQEVKDEAIERMPELLKQWKMMNRRYELRKKATMDERIFSPASGSTRLI
jgi:hypothetical protein